MGTEDGLAMTAEFCESYVTACGADLDLPNSYCAEHVLEGSKTEYWSYPLNIVGECGVHGHFTNYLFYVSSLPSPAPLHLSLRGGLC